MPADSVRTLTILHLNDVYELTPVEGGAAGGLARVATLRQRLLAENPRLLTVLAGDFLSPSALGTARVDGQRLAGRQMVAVLNALGLDVAALGNHEFDLTEDDFRARMAEARFPHVSGNARPAPGAPPFPNVSERLVLRAGEARGEPVTVGIVSAVIPSTVKPYVAYDDALETLARDLAALPGDVDVRLALTHLDFGTDLRAAETLALDLVLGGHEHDNILARRGPMRTPIAKADANARTVWVHRVHVHARRGVVGTEHELVFIDETIPEDAAVAAEVARWVEAGFAGFRADGFEPTRRVATLPEPLDGREATVRNRPAPLAALIAEGFYRAARADGAPAEAAVFNGGSIRIDDVLTPGVFTEYDAIRVLPFGGEVVSVRLPGALLARVLAQGLANVGTGGYLQTHGLALGEDGRWRIGGQPLDPDRVYTIATSDFLVSGRETGLGYFNAASNPDVTITGRHGDVRRALILEVVRRYGAE
ncbi:MAG: bifunctional metallophosphatase/5'-nucleotidase [Rubricoccaceae bacterium]